MKPDKTLADRIANLSSEKRALLESRLKQNNSAKIQVQLTMPRRQNQAPAPLSFAQQRLWFLDQLEPESSFYNVPHAVRLQGTLNVEALREALNTIVDRHEILRTTISVVDGNPIQVISENSDASLSVVDLSETPEPQRQNKAHGSLRIEIQRPFELSRDLMLRATLLKLDRADHILLLVTHHIASDGWSTGILWGELAALYRAFSREEANPLPELPVQYADYAVWQRQWLHGEFLERQLSYWKHQLTGIPALDLATDRPRPAIQTYRGDKQSLVLPKTLSDQLQGLSRKEGVTFFMTLLAAFQTLLHRYSGQDDIVVGSPIAGRTRSETEALIGFFVNTLVLRNDLSGNPTFRELLHRVRQMALGAYEHQDIPFDKLVEELHPDRDLSRSPLFQVMFAFQNAPRQSRELPGLTVSPVEIVNETAKFDLSLYTWEEKEGLRARVEYNTDLFDAATIHRMLAHFATLVQGIVTNPDRHLSDLPILTEIERSQLLIEWNNTQKDYPKDKCIHELFEAQVEKSPDAVAVVFGDEQLTYRELNTQANQLAHYLRNLRVGAESLVGVCMERSLEMIVGLLGVLKAGGAYVPLDPAYPKERLAFMLEDSRALVVLTQHGLLDSLPPSRATIVCMDREWKKVVNESDKNPDSKTTSDNAAYLIYTSGSTGKPKGVAIEHRSPVAFLTWAHSAFAAEDLAGVLASTSICFDLSVFELFAPLTTGGRVILAEDALALPTLPAVSQVTLINTVPSAMAELLRLDGIPPSVRTVNLAGEPLGTGLVQQIYEKTSAKLVYDLYGPSEDTTYSTYALRTSQGPQTIGRPISNTCIYILDGQLNPTPTGIPGELYLGGGGLARGYLNRPDLTAERFVPDPFSNKVGARLYRTGDVARYLSDANVEFLGRLDNQVKVRGFRIELGEIETVVGQHPAVRQSVMMVREGAPGEKQLVAYIVLKEEQVVTVSELCDFLNRKLPNYMLPSAFVFLETLPLTPNGKLDRRALPAPDGSRPGLQEAFVAPRTPTEKKIAVIWGKVLSIDEVGLRDNFFELGGHSLLAIKVISALRKQFQFDIPVRLLFEAPTIAQLAARIECQNDQAITLNKGKATYSHLIKLHSGPNRKRIFCFPYRCGVQGEYVHFMRLARYLGADYSFYGLQAKAADSVTPPHASVEELATNYVREIEDLEPNGPYYLIGDCAGAPEAYETARQLWARGKKVGLLVLMDARGPYLPSQYWRVGPFSVKHLDRVRDRLLSSRLWAWCAYLVAATSFHLKESNKLPRGKRWRYLTAKVLKEVRTQRRLSQESSTVPSQELETDLSESEEQLMEHVSRARRLYRSNWPSDYGGRLAVIVNKQWYGFDRSFGWAGVADGGVETYAIPGDHISYMLEHVPLVADRLRACIEKASKET